MSCALKDQLGFEGAPIVKPGDLWTFTNFQTSDNLASDQYQRCFCLVYEQQIRYFLTIRVSPVDTVTPIVLKTTRMAFFTTTHEPMIVTGNALCCFGAGGQVTSIYLAVIQCPCFLRVAVGTVWLILFLRCGNIMVVHCCVSNVMRHGHRCKYFLAGKPQPA